MKRSLYPHLLLAPDSAGAAAALATPPAGGDKPAAAAPSGNVPNIDNKPDADVDMFTELDQMARPPAKEKPAAPPADKAKLPDSKEKPPEKPVEKPTEDPNAQPDLNTPKGLRKHAQRLESDNKAARDQIKQLEEKIAAAEAKGKDTTALNDRLAALEKERDGYLAEIRALKQEASPEFQEKYEKPWKNAAEYAKQVVQSLEAYKVDEDGIVLETRQASWENDFAPIYDLSRKSMSAAIKQAKATFGDAAPTVIGFIQDLHRKEHERNVALNEERENFKKKQDEEVANQSKQREWVESTWAKVNTELSDKNPEHFQPDPKDKQRAEIFTKSLQLVDSRHNGAALTPIQRINLDANVRLRAAAYPVLQYDNNKLKERVAELEEQLAGKQDGEPGSTQRPTTGTPGKAPEKSFSEALNELD